MWLKSVDLIATDWGQGASFFPYWTKPESEIKIHLGVCFGNLHCCSFLCLPSTSATSQQDQTWRRWGIEKEGIKRAFHCLLKVARCHRPDTEILHLITSHNPPLCSSAWSGESQWVRILSKFFPPPLANYPAGCFTDWVASAQVLDEIHFAGGLGSSHFSRIYMESLRWERIEPSGTHQALQKLNGRLSSASRYRDHRNMCNHVTRVHLQRIRFCTFFCAA